jgi:hypothetical protein
MVVVVGTIFVSTCGMTAPRTTAPATDEAVMPISPAGKGWDTTTPSAWSNKNKKKKKKTKTKTKTKTKAKTTTTTTTTTTVVATPPPLRLQTATPVLLLLLPLRKQRQQQWQHWGSSGSSSSRLVAVAAHYFELPHSITLASPCSASGIKFPFLIYANTL